MAAVLMVIVFLLGAFHHESLALKYQSLNGEWLLRNEEYKDVKATVPGGIYSDLMTSGIIDNIHYGNNDVDTRWVATKNWTFYTVFTVAEDILDHTNINIVFEGLDTFSTISINDNEVGKSENMFVRYIFSIKQYLKTGNNTIEVNFISPITVANTLTNHVNYSIPPECPPIEYNGECHVNQIRKMQASFAWDWGPAFPSMGIWKDVYLEAFNSSIIRYVLVDLKEAPNDSWTIKTSTYLHPGDKKHSVGQLVLNLQTDLGRITEIVNVDHEIDDHGEVTVDFSFNIPKLAVKRWWPNGYGEPKLYELILEFKNGTEQSKKISRVGFRKVELIQENLGSGLSFYFKINDVPIFAKGANEIPLDILPERGQDPGTIKRILVSAYKVNMNMIRVWGGGVYESDLFYETADELGIMIWQDFMFACALYPTYPEFLNNVVEEVRHQVRRLNSHPSIVVWAANNENEVALATNWFNTKSKFDLYKQDFIELYVTTVKSETGKLIDGIFLTSSPTNGKESEEEGYLAKNPQDQYYGDVHFYNYVTNSLDFSTYPIPRFASEFGYQSLPDIDTWLTVTQNLADLQPSSTFMSHRQHHPLGSLENYELITFQLNMNTASDNYYKTYIFFSQIVQALSIKFETELYRRYMGRLDDQGKGNTMGALYWQLNDVWVAPTWSGIDYTGKWKLLHYFAKDFFAPTIITGYLNIQRQLEVYVVSEVPSLMGTSLNVTVIIEVFNWKSFTPINTTEIDTTIEYGKSLLVTTINSDDFLRDLGCGSLSSAKENCFFYLTLKIGNLILAPNNYVFPTSLKNANLSTPTIKISSVKQVDKGGQKFEIVITSDSIALFVYLDSHQQKGLFSENGFLQISENKTVIYESELPTSVAELNKTLTVTHLKDHQYV